MTTLAGKIPFVTGGAREGATVAFTYQQSVAPAAALVTEMEAAGGGRALALQADAADRAVLTDAINGVAHRLGRMDILVNNAGVLLLGALESFSLEDFHKMIAANVRAVFIAAKAALPHMGQGGRIINIGSTNAERMPFTGGRAYAMSKSALVGLVQGMARDPGPRGITVNNVQPGPTDTDMNPEAGEFGAALHGLMALQRHATPDEIAGMVAYIAGREAGFVTGASLTIDGGFSA
ncbi:SDR family oxidoreductase [Cupriavidus lacunae]|uniref:Oxidoreductase n=1 Tax=Cupriavidus lacunae TaxID=2666307 RepID=A0A370NIR2_9BURK|nr:SDR family oxidoreductase [Cupriavidus lacunae]RDK05462.1 oxidoreductase [Cupriavidus lacunae]